MGTMRWAICNKKKRNLSVGLDTIDITILEPILPKMIIYQPPNDRSMVETRLFNSTTTVLRTNSYPHPRFPNFKRIVVNTPTQLYVVGVGIVNTTITTEVTIRMDIVGMAIWVIIPTFVGRRKVRMRSSRTRMGKRKGLCIVTDIRGRTTTSLVVTKRNTIICFISVFMIICTTVDTSNPLR